MPAINQSRPARRNRNSAKRRQDIVEGAVRLLADSGGEGLSIIALADALKINRAIIYYHFENREALLDAVMDWSSEQLSKTFTPTSIDAARGPSMTDLVLDNAGLLRLWTERLITSADIASSYPDWDAFVEALSNQMSNAFPGMEADMEIFAMILLVGTIIGPRAFHTSVDPTSSFASVTDRFRHELNRLIGYPVAKATDKP